MTLCFEARVSGIRDRLPRPWYRPWGRVGQNQREAPVAKAGRDPLILRRRFIVETPQCGAPLQAPVQRDRSLHHLD